MSDQNETHIKALSKAYRENNLSLYLGAGVSVGNGLPAWDKLVLAMYFSVIDTDEIVAALRPYPNYLFAIAEWHLERQKEPLDITARKILNLSNNEKGFLDNLHRTLYAAFFPPRYSVPQVPPVQKLLKANATLNAIVEMCKINGNTRGQIKSVITYNYDNLLELTMEPHQTASIWKANQRWKRGALPVFHVHGYVPIVGPRSTVSELIFTEEQYYLAAQNAYSWNNLVQVKYLSSSVGLMIGLSLTDRNLRRLLDALKKTPTPPQSYIILQKPTWQRPAELDIDKIDKQAANYFAKFQQSGLKVISKKGSQINQIIDGVETIDMIAEGQLLKELGVNPIWYTDHSEVPKIISQIISG